MCWGKKLVTPPNCLRELLKAKKLTFSGRELRYLKLLASRPAWILSNWGDRENCRLEISGNSSPHSPCRNYPREHSGKEAPRGLYSCSTLQQQSHRIRSIKTNKNKKLPTPTDRTPVRAAA
jgi:hypothetical protein